MRNFFGWLLWKTTVTDAAHGKILRFVPRLPIFAIPASWQREIADAVSAAAAAHGVSVTVIFG